MFLASWVFKLKGNSASEECTEFLVQQRRAVQPILLIKNSPPPWVSRGECLGDPWKICKATVLMPRPLAGSLRVPPVPSLCNHIRPPLVSVVGTVRQVPRSQFFFLSEVRVVLVSPRNMAWERHLPLSKQPLREGDRWVLFWQLVRPALGPSWTMTVLTLPSWHRENVNSQFLICLGNYRFWSKSFWCEELWVSPTGSDTNTLSSASPEKLMSKERKETSHRLTPWRAERLDRCCVNCFEEPVGLEKLAML